MKKTYTDAEWKRIQERADAYERKGHDVGSDGPHLTIKNLEKVAKDQNDRALKETSLAKGKDQGTQK